MIVNHGIQWVAPAPLWSEATRAATVINRSAALGRPAVLRFASDEFMDEFMSTLDRDPAQLGRLRAIYETWREPAPAIDPPARLSGVARRLKQGHVPLPPPDGDPTTAEVELVRLTSAAPQRPAKLYQPAHQRFYLLAACLVCQTAGLPDRTLDAGRQERATFVVRRLRHKDGAAEEPDPLSPSSDWQEYAFVTEGRDMRWKPVSAGSQALAPDEEQLPLFPVSYLAEDGRRRRILAGLIPVARREVYMAARRRAAADAGQDDSDAPEALDARLVLLRNDVMQAWWSMDALEQKTSATLIQANSLSKDTRPLEVDRASLQAITDDQVQLLSWYALLDFGAYLKAYLPDVHAALGTTPPAAMPTAQRDLVLALRQASDGTRTLAAALLEIEGWRGSLEDTTEDYTTRKGADGKYINQPTSPPWPNFAFRLTAAGIRSLFDDLGNGVTPLEQRVRAALATAPAHKRPPAPLLASQPAPDIGERAWFVIRCVFSRPSCGALCPPVVSAPTAVFELASFFDPDAPARPIRIAMPVDTTPGGLRKFAKNTAFLLSDHLACQKDRLGKLTFGDLVLSVLPWPFHKDLPSDTAECSGIGQICMLSIPIITICALILLLIIVSLLNIIFFWIPFFIQCFPLPGLKAKR